MATLLGLLSLVIFAVFPAAAALEWNELRANRRRARRYRLARRIQGTPYPIVHR